MPNGGPRNSDGLTPKQERFCEEYLVDLNAAAAARRAGYSKQTAGVIGLENLAKTMIAERIAAMRAERSERVQVDADRVLRELCLLGFSNMADFLIPHDDGTASFDFSALTRDKAASIQEFVVDEYMDGRGEDARDVKRTRFKLADKKAALESIGRHLGMFTDKIKVGGDENAPPIAGKLIVTWGDGSK